jgi:hypothetical protein
VVSRKANARAREFRAGRRRVREAETEAARFQFRVTGAAAYVRRHKTRQIDSFRNMSRGVPGVRSCNL